MDVPNSHLPLGSLRGWLLATGEGRWKSTAKSGSASNWHGIWMHDASKQKLAAWRIVVPPAESPDLLTLTNLGLAPTLQLGQDVLGFGTAHQMMFAAHPWMKPCGQRWQEMQQVDNLCPCPKFVPGCPNLSHPGAPLYAAVNPSRPLLHPGRPKYSMARPAVQLLAENSPKSCPQRYLAGAAGCNGANKTSLPDSCH